MAPLPGGAGRAFTAVLIVLQLASMAAAVDERPPDPARGLYAVWAKDDVWRLPFLKGGQIHLLWSEVEPRQGQYDFRRLDAELARMQRLSRPMTVQLNANRHPDWMFECVPHHPERLSPQVGDRRGTLMYWHPAYVDAYLKLLAAYGKHLRQSAHRDAVLGVRLNFNALGTEHFEVPAQARGVSAWRVPAGAERPAPWSREAVAQYKSRVVTAHVAAFTPDIRVFVRNNAIEAVEADPALAGGFARGQLALFHTSSEIEPRSSGTERQYLAFLRYARSGQTVAYAEPWADAWGRHGGITDSRWCSPSQWNYWRLLADLHCGVSFIALYGADLAHANEAEFREAFDFAARYAGHHASPSVSPGAWVAFREGKYLKGDYNFLMRRLEGDPTQAVAAIGPSAARYGAWARVVPAGGQLRVAIDPRFVASVGAAQVKVSLTWLDEHPVQARLIAGDNEMVIEGHGSAGWKRSEFSIDGASLATPIAGAALTLHTDRPLAVHMIEIRR